MKILVVMGGISSEKEISLKSGENIYNKLKTIYPNTQKYILTDLRDFYKHILESEYDFIFLALHGKYGEDGTIQSFLESLNIPFSFSGSLASMIGMNKMIANLLVERFIKDYNIVNLNIPKTAYINFQEYSRYGIEHAILKIKRNSISIPLIVKPNSSGSSVGLSLIQKEYEFEKELEKAIQIAFEEDKTVIIQEYIDGREITVGVIQENEEIIPLEPCELELNESKLFDYENKYIKKINHIIPPNLPKEINNYLKEISVRIFEFIGFKDAVRIDYRIRENKDSLDVFFLEVNTIPGFTDVSLLPQEAKKTGIPFDKLLDIIIQNNLK
ncbi:MAG: D-alanine--D-alanine ligase [Candidatus Calescibacterium sp.]|nr:D-alanine--D-alanine ligase [Candidatus Calescibacterium sp.]MCX7972846.1 D-alanine--D-alanine ligase [bacterium]MDW8195232.1 D-alanine--D-alanine ligase [Candidatus Calescibacterium sp.]